MYAACAFSTVIKGEGKKPRYLDLWWNFQVWDRLLTVGFADQMQGKASLNGIFLGHLREWRCKGRSSMFQKRPRNDERGNISFLETIANFSGGWVVRWKENWPWESGTQITAPGLLLTSSPALGKSLHLPDLIFLTCQGREVRPLSFKHSMIPWEAVSFNNLKRRVFFTSSCCLCYCQQIARLKCVPNS